MKIRLPFSAKILLPYLVITAMFAMVFFSGPASLSPDIRWVSLAGMLLTLVFAIFQMIWLRKHLSKVRSLVKSLTLGQLPAFSAKRPSDEIGELLQALDNHIQYLRSLTRFAGQISSGDFSGSLEMLSSEDEIGQAMLSLKNSLEASARDSEARRTEEEHRTWTAQGMATFSRLFREVEEDLEALSGAVAKELVEYTRADVGALFIATDPADGAPVLELKGSFAFDRQKHVQRTFEFGEGLVGRAALEKDVIYLTDLPPETIKIRSGLGEDAPSSLLLVPLMVDTQVLGVIELASLDVFPDYQIGFIRQLGEALATTLAKVKANIQTREQAETHREFHKREQELLMEIERLKKS